MTTTHLLGGQKRKFCASNKPEFIVHCPKSCGHLDKVLMSQKGVRMGYRDGHIEDVEIWFKSGLLLELDWD